MRFKSLLLTPTIAAVAVAALTGVGIGIEQWSQDERAPSQVESVAASQTPGSGSVPEIDSVPTTEQVAQTVAPAPRPTPRTAPAVSYDDDDEHEHEDDDEHEYDDD